MSLVGNERAKLTATYVNGIALIIFGAGGFGPIISYAYGTGPAGASSFVIGSISFVCILVSIALHVVARRFLRALR